MSPLGRLRSAHLDPVVRPMVPWACDGGDPLDRTRPVLVHRGRGWSSRGHYEVELELTSLGAAAPVLVITATTSCGGDRVIVPWSRVIAAVGEVPDDDDGPSC